MNSARVGLRECWIGGALAAYLLVRFAPQIDGLSPQGQAVLGAMAVGAILWISEATPIGLTAIGVVVLLALSPGARLSDAAGGFASEVVFFLIGAVAIGTAVEVSGLAERAARFLSRIARGSPARLYVQMIASLPAFAVLVPSAITRNAILIPAYRDALDRMGISQTDRSGRMLMLALGCLIRSLHRRCSRVGLPRSPRHRYSADFPGCAGSLLCRCRITLCCSAALCYCAG